MAAAGIGALLVWILALSGCAPLVIGVGALSGGAVAYNQGMQLETYPADYRQSVAASRDTLAALKIPVTGTVGDELKTTLSAKRPDQTPVTVEVVRLGPGQTQIGIRTGAIGVSELDTSARIHEQIRDRLARSTPQEARSSSPPHLRFPPDDPAPAKAAPEPVRKPPAAPPRPVPPAGVSIYFDSGSNELLESEHPKLDRIVSTLTTRPGAIVTLNGYADSTGPSDYNRMVSESRASTIKMYLVGKGVDAGRIRVIGHGSRNSIGASSGEGRQSDRRVEIAFDFR
jgi:outer membrane protein OmpA-like peptidoglycan-associated protein